jgi:hypothetical protein
VTVSALANGEDVHAKVTDYVTSARRSSALPAGYCHIYADMLVRLLTRDLSEASSADALRQATVAAGLQQLGVECKLSLFVSSQDGCVLVMLTAFAAASMPLENKLQNILPSCELGLTIICCPDRVSTSSISQLSLHFVLFCLLSRSTTCCTWRFQAPLPWYSLFHNPGLRLQPCALVDLATVIC